MTRTMIYLIAIFALWLFFKYGNFETTEKKTMAEKYNVKDFDKAQSGFGGRRA